MSDKQLQLWEVFTQKKTGMSFEHAGSVRAADKEMALLNARDVYSRRGEATCIWVVPSECISSSSPEDIASFLNLQMIKFIVTRTFIKRLMALSRFSNHE